MAVDIPDAATIWRELGEFQTVLDSYVKQQSDLSDRLRKSHLEFCQDHKLKIETVEGQKKKAAHELDLLSAEKQKEKEELDRLRVKTTKLQRESSELPERLKQYKEKDEQQQRRTSKTREAVEKAERLHKTEYQLKADVLKAYQRGLGLTIHRRSTGELSFKFTHIDDTDLEAAFEFVIMPNQEKCSLVSCQPPLERAQSIIDSYNASQSQTKVSTMVRLFRREFKASLTQ